MRRWHLPKEMVLHGDCWGGGEAVWKHGVRPLCPICAEDARRDVLRLVCASAHGPSLASPWLSLLKAAKRDVNICTAGVGLQLFVVALSQLMYLVPVPIPSPGPQE